MTEKEEAEKVPPDLQSKKAPTVVEQTTRQESALGELALVAPSIRAEIAGALTLLDFVVQTGHRNANGQSLTSDIFAAIKTAAAKAANSAEPITVAEWTRFELAYYALAQFAYPVNAETLANTQETGDPDKESVAERFTRGLLWTTIAFGMVVIFSEWGLQRFAPVREGEIDLANTLMQFLRIMLPWAYGGLGACVFLLKTAHMAMYTRSFDIRRKPEYFNRVLLGAVSGGAIILIINQLAGDDGGLVRISSGALGFIAGYSSDFLFNTLERIINAILPKVGLESIQHSQAGLQQSAGFAPMTMADFLVRLKEADQMDKALIRALIAKQFGVASASSASETRKPRKRRVPPPGTEQG